MKNKFKSLSTLLLITFNYLLFTNLSAQLVQDFRVNDDSTNYNQTNAKMGVDKQGNFVVVWEDGRRSGRGNIFCQRFDTLANRIGNNFIINTILDSAVAPDISVRSDGSFGVCWIQGNSTIMNRVRLLFRIFDKDGLPLSSEIMVNDTITSYDVKGTVSSDTSGRFVVAFRFKNNNDYNIYFQIFDNLGNKIRSNIKVNDDTGSYDQDYPTITTRQDGSFIITWQDQRPPVPMNGQDDIFMQMYNNNGMKLGNNVRVNDVIHLEDREYYPYISSDSSGAFCIGFTRWNFYPNTYNAILQLYNKNGNKIGNNITVANSISETSVKAISKRDNGDMVIGFGYDNGIRWRAYLERRNYSGNIIPGLYQISNQALNIDNGYSDVYLFKNNIISLIVDNRNGNGDVFCNIRSFLNPDSVITNILANNNNIPQEYKLFQNYPNPFNSMSNVKWQMSDVGNAKIVIFDILGKEIVTLFKDKLKPGTYEVKFDGSNLPSGLYFYTLVIDGIRIDTKKLILLK